MMYDGNNKYFPLLLIGRDVQIGPDEADTVGCLCVSSSGRIAIVDRDPAITGEDDSAFLERMTRYSDLLRSWDLSKLDEIAADYYYRTEGQAMRIIDLMARAGLLVFADEGLFSIRVTRGLMTERHLVILISQAVEDFRRDTLCCGEFANADMLFSFVDSKNLPF